MSRLRSLLLSCVPFALLALDGCTSTTADSRRFSFEYAAEVSGFPEGARQARVWLPVPSSDETQTIGNLRVTAPVPHRISTEPVYGNRIAYLEIEAPFPESIPVTVSFDVERVEVNSRRSIPGIADPARLLRGDALAPIDGEARSRAESATAGRSGHTAQARGVYDSVLAAVDYDKSGTGWGRGDLSYVCSAGAGNCSDFHALFIAMARSQEIPSIFEIGFPLPAGEKAGTIGGYHCWAWFQDDAGAWRPIDASEADKHPEKTEYFFGTIDRDRVALSRGRDLVLEPAQSGGPVNFLIYPYVEIDGRADVAKVERTFRFEDLD